MSESVPPAGEPSPAKGTAAPQAPEQTTPGDGGVVVRYGLMRQIGRFSHSLESPPAPGSKVVVLTERGVELGEVVVGICDSARWGAITAERLEQFIADSGPEYPFGRNGKLLRPANPQDIIDHRHLEGSAREEATFCRRGIHELGLKMKLVTVEHLLGGERIIFYFSAGSRVDFRELVHRLAEEYRTRIEMRQVGARDEARLIADYERCGRQCCCQQFLKNLKPISMRMAKIQKATLDPSKISGRCGRLMCCLRYEDADYEELQKKLPKRNTYVRTQQVTGRVVETQILTQLVRIELPDNSQTVIANEDILERGAEPLSLPDPPAAPQKPRVKPATAPAKRPKRLPPQPDGESQPQGQAAESSPSAAPGAAEKAKSPPKRRRRRGGKKHRPAGPKQSKPTKGSNRPRPPAGKKRRRNKKKEAR